MEGETKEIVSIWNLHKQINFDEITQIFEGEKYSVIQEKLENLRKSSDSVASDSADFLSQSANSLTNENLEEEELLTATTAPGIVFPSVAARLAHFRSDYHRWNLKLKLMQMPMLTRTDFDEMMAAARTNATTQSMNGINATTANGDDEERGEMEALDAMEEQAMLLAEAERLAAEDDGMTVCERVTLVVLCSWANIIIIIIIIIIHCFWYVLLRLAAFSCPGTSNEHVKHLKGAAKVDFITCDRKRISVWKQLLGSSSRKCDRSLVSFVKGSVVLLASCDSRR
jgi:hypothetical protein